MKKIFLTFLVIFTVISVPFAAYAALNLVPCGNSGASTDVCTLCDLIVGVHNVIDFLLRMVFAVALVIITIAGVIYIVSAGDSGAVEKAKSAIKGAFFGIIITLSAWLIVTTIMNVLARGGGFDLEGEGWTNKFNCASIVSP